MNIGRITSGSLKRKVILMPTSNGVRPTSDAVKGMIFNVLRHKFYVDFAETYVVDMFAGSGALGLEALSLGAQFCLFLDNSRDSILCVKKNLQSLALESRAHVYQIDIKNINLNILQNILQENILLLLDPPYNDKHLLTRALELVDSVFQNKKNVILVVETDALFESKQFETVCVKRFGKTYVTFLLFPSAPVF